MRGVSGDLVGSPALVGRAAPAVQGASGDLAGSAVQAEWGGPAVQLSEQEVQGNAPPVRNVLVVLLVT